MKILSVVGNRPQFIKSGAALRGAARGRARGGRRAHRPALRPRALGDLLRGARTCAARLPARHRRPARATRCWPGCGPLRRRDRRANSPTRCSSTATRTRRSPAPARPRARDVPRRPRRGGPAQRRPVDARGTQPRSRPTGSRSCCSARTSARARPWRARASSGGREVVGDVMLDATPAARADRAPALEILERFAVEPGRLRRRDDPPRGQRAARSACGRSSTALGRLGEPRRLPRAPAHPLGARKRR